jgi:AcrR family transcriptional regulator
MKSASVTPDEAEPTLGRRERKRLETRSALVRAAIDLFAANGFDEVTVTDIAEQADVDPSTFFRHFGSKEAVLFTDVVAYLGRVRRALLARPTDELLLDSLAAATVDNSTLAGFDADQEVLRAKLTESTPAIHAQALVYREDLVRELAEAIGERLAIDPSQDPRPYLAASTWIAGFEWYRRNSILTGRRPTSAPRAITEIVTLLRPNWHVLNDLMPVAATAKTKPSTAKSAATKTTKSPVKKAGVASSRNTVGRR